ncbi:MAG: hypothetical protein ACI9HK_005653 [Pirellulaceae bacterium]|jgi:hypothetical protein
MDLFVDEVPNGSILTCGQQRNYAAGETTLLGKLRCWGNYAAGETALATAAPSKAMARGISRLV